MAGLINGKNSLMGEWGSLGTDNGSLKTDIASALGIASL